METEQTAAARDVLAERERQISAEGWTTEHDDEHGKGELSDAAACYALFWPFNAGKTAKPVPANFWPWSLEDWKPSDRRRNLVKAGALILAEIERIDRSLSPKAEPNQ